MTPQTKQPAIDIDAVSGPELDALVAEHVMGWVVYIETPSGARLVVDQYPAFVVFITSPALGWLYRRVSVESAIWSPSDNLEHAREVEAEIERRGLVDGWPNGYVEQLVRECVPYIDEDWDEHSAPRTYDDITRAEMFLVINATPEQRNRAALKTVMATTGPLDTD